MLTKRIQVAVYTSTWGRRPLPVWASLALPQQPIDIGQALLMLGSLTTPNGWSAGSPERYWACIRYLTACTPETDLRIRTPFTELDPHQKGILSDDFGVALSTQWLVTQLGGIRTIVDGRRFIINMGVRPRRRERLAKVGTRKCPDFVLEDLHGKFHVLECKGTQSGIRYLERAMATGEHQKAGIRIARALRGERLVIGISLSAEGQEDESQLMVTDPEDEPLTVIKEADKGKAEQILARLSMSRALNLTGFGQAAFEIAWPQELNRSSPEVEFLSAAERKGLSRDSSERLRSWQSEIDAEFRSAPQREVGDFITQKMRFDLPPVILDSGNVATSVVVTRGMSSGVVRDLARSGGEIRAAAEEKAVAIAARQEKVVFKRNDSSARIEYSDIFFSELQFE